MLGHLGIVGEVVVNGVDRPKFGNALYGAYGQDFLTRDGRRIMVIGLTDRQWTGLVRVLGAEAEIAALADRLRLDLAKEGNRFRARKEITAVFAPWFAARDYADIAALFDKAGLTWAPFRSFAEAVREDPDLSEDNPMIRVLDQPGIGRYPVPGSPVQWGALPRLDPVRAPRLGEHSEAVLADVLGLGSGEIGRLMDAGIVAGA